jgi:glycosyltransferase involved in cell wall biosynthesis
MLDLHHLGHRQTGNESWARSLASALFELGGPRSYDIGVTRSAPREDLAVLPAREIAWVSGSSTRRLALDLPAAMRRLKTSSVLVQYTAPISRVPAVVAVHDLSFEDPRAAEWLPLATRLRYRATIRASVHRAAHVLALSESTRSDLLEIYGLAPERVSVVPAAVDPAFAALLAATPDRRDPPLTVLAVGNVLPRKNLVVVARAVRILRDRGFDVRFRVVGTVSPRGASEAREMTALLGSAVEFSGHVDRSGLASAYRSAHVLAFPSLFEGFGIPVLEAMAADLPVLVADRTSLPEVVGDAGLVLPAEDAGAWADGIRDIVLDTAGAALVLRGRLRLADFTWMASAALVRPILTSAASQRRRVHDRRG